MSEFGEPRYYAYRSHHLIDTKLFKISFPERYIVLLEFDVMTDVADPRVEPILVYSYAGMRRYLWRDVYWGEVDLPTNAVRERIGELLAKCRDKQEAIKLRQLADRINDTQNSPAPHPDDTREIKLNPMQRIIQSAFPGMVDPDANRVRRWCRAIYRINQR